MTITKDEIAVWVFSLPVEVNKIKNTFNYLLSINTLIKCLVSEELLIPEKVIFLGNEGRNREIALGFNYSSELISFKIVEYLKQEINSDISTPMVINGRTKLFIDGEYKLMNDIMSVEIDFNSVEPRFVISTYSDCWVPIDREDAFQVDLSIDASKRLEKCLDRIDNELFVIDRFPNIDEECVGMYILPQKGNRVYTESPLSRLIMNENVLKYIWKNRNDYRV